MEVLHHGAVVAARAHHDAVAEGRLAHQRTAAIGADGVGRDEGGKGNETGTAATEEGLQPRPQTVRHAVHLNLRVAIVDDADRAARPARLLQLGEEGVEETVVVVGEPEADVAAVQLPLVAGHGVLQRVEHGSKRVLLAEVGLYIEFVLRIEDLGERGETEIHRADMPAPLRKEIAHSRQHGNNDSHKQQYPPSLHLFSGTLGF